MEKSLKNRKQFSKIYQYPLNGGYDIIKIKRKIKGNQDEKQKKID